MADPAASAAAQDEDARRFLTFRMDERLYALPAEEVAEVIRLPVVARVPLAPPSLLGMANLRGEVLPVASLRGLLGRPEAAQAEGARAIVLGGAAPVALAVDQVAALMTVPAGSVERETALAADDGEQLRGAFQAAGDEVVKVLDLQALLAAGFTPRAPASRRAGGPAAKEPAARAEMDERRRLVVFEVAGQEFAFDLAVVREIVEQPDHLAAAPRAEALVMGVAAYRDRLLPLLSLRGLLGFPAGARRGKVLVVTVGGALVGLVVDRMRTVVAAAPDELEPPPPVLAARAGGEATLAAIYRGDGGRRLVSILEPEQLFREDVMRRLGAAEPAAQGQAVAAGGSDDERRFVVFRLGEDEFALPVEAVEEVARAPDQITRLPRTPAFLEGVINLRGEVLPVIDQRRRFDMPPLSDASRRRLVVVRTERHRAGLIVDSVSEVLRSGAAAIAPAPDLAGHANRLVVGVINLDDAARILLVLDPAELLSRTERSLLDAFATDAE